MRKLGSLSVLLTLVVLWSCNEISLENVDFPEKEYEDWQKEIGLVVHIDKAKEVYNPNESLDVHCIIKNIGSKAKSFSFKEYDDHYGRLNFPASLSVYIVDEQNNPLCETPNQYMNAGLMFTRSASDYIILQPEEEIRRTFDVSRIAGDCDARLIGGVAPGIYKVIIAVDDSFVSNELILTVDSLYTD